MTREIEWLLMAHEISPQPPAVRNRSSPRKDETVSLLRILFALATAASLTGCGVVAFPVRTTSAAVKIVPVAGDVVAYPLDKTADAID
jgi:hypothetical protein